MSSARPSMVGTSMRAPRPASETLMGTWITSIVGVVFAALIAPYWHVTGMAIAPDWLLGTMFGVGGLCGMYLGARTQRYVSAFALKLLIGVVLFAAALNYLIRVPLGL